VRGGHGTTSSGYGRYSSEKMAQKKKHCSRTFYIFGFLKGETFSSTIKFFIEGGSDPEASVHFRINHELKFLCIKTTDFGKLN
jgi:hypothetical protein